MMSDSGTGQGGSFSYQKGVWLSKGEGARSEKYQKWTEDRTRSQVQQLDRQKHSSLVKLNGECLQVRNELRGLKNERHQLSRRQGSSMSADGAESLPHNSLSSTSSSATGTKGVRKSPSIGSLASLSSGYSSLSSSSSVGRRSSGADTEGVGSRGKGPGLGLGPVLKGWNADVTALRLKNFHSARALSKLNNDMDIIH